MERAVMTDQATTDRPILVLTRSLPAPLLQALGELGQTRLMTEDIDADFSPLGLQNGRQVRPAAGVGCMQR